MARAEREGWVKIEFVISSFGSVQDVKVLESSQKDFEEASLKALSKWRYALKIVNGEVVNSEALKIRLDFTMEPVTNFV